MTDTSVSEDTPQTIKEDPMIHEDDSLSHKEVIERTQDILKELLADPILKDIPLDVTPGELKAKIDLENGCAFVVNLKRQCEEGFNYVPLIAKQKTTVRELKLDIQRAVGRKVREEGGTSCISWKYFWKTYWLVHNNEKLADDSKILRDHGIRHGSEITFLKRLRKK